MLVLLLAVGVLEAEEAVHRGVLAVAVGDEVVLADPTGTSVEGFSAGTVGWLYPAPGGLLFAPDLVNGRTTVLDLRQRRVAERLDGVTMPVFGRSADRYVVAAGDVMLFSYPDRALLAEVPAAVEHAWQVLLIGGDTGALVLERRPDGRGTETLTRVDLVARRASEPWPLTGDITDMAISSELGLLALADHDGGVQLVDASNMVPVATWRVEGRPSAVAFAAEGETLVAACQGRRGGGSLSWARVKTGRDGLRLAKEERSALDGVPVDLAVAPDGRAAAVVVTAGSSGRLYVLDLKRGEVAATVPLDGPPRSVVWCDPSREGPLRPEWSEGFGR